MQPQIERLQRMAQRADNKEVMAWLQATPSGTERSLGLLTKTAESLQIAKEIYKLGAKQVLAIDVATYDWGENTGKLLIELPLDAASRGKLFAWCAQVAESQGFDPTTDNGQPYLFVMLD